jgi:broad specificity phosphatase PhoE
MSGGPHLYFIRHGETAWSLSGQHTGKTDLALTANGEAMARQLAAMLKKIPFSQVLTSPRLRARQTCALAELDTTASIEPLLAEWDYGDYEGLRTAEIQQQHPGWDVWQHGCPRGESPSEIGERADKLLDRLRSCHGNIALFSHGQFGRVLAARWIGLPTHEGQHFAIDPATLGILGHERDHPERHVIALWNATSGNGLGRHMDKASLVSSHA